jgi:hypothetical protein
VTGLPSITTGRARAASVRSSPLTRRHRASTIRKTGRDSADQPEITDGRTNTAHGREDRTTHTNLSDSVEQITNRSVERVIQRACEARKTPNIAESVATQRRSTAWSGVVCVQRNFCAASVALCCGHPAELLYDTHPAREVEHELSDRAERPLLCPGDVPLTTATSALIKALRRGRELEALYWARLIEVRYPKYVLRKLATFACEDVGPADPGAVQVVAAIGTLYRSDLGESRAFRPDKNLLAMAVMYLARAPKSRECDDLANALAHLVDGQGWEPDVPEYVLDMHTPEGREQSDEEQLTQWLTEGRRIVGDEGPLDWRLWIDRHFAREGVLDRDEVEEQARVWDEQGRLRYGVDGYQRRVD